MPQLFPRRADTILRAAVALAVLALVLAGLVARGVIDPARLTGAATGAQAAVPQPSDFSHRLHAGEIGIGCRMCHTSVAKGPEAGYPQQWTCASCHLALDPKPELDWRVAWNRVRPLQEGVYFHHGIHVARGIGCATCHGPVETMIRVFPVREFTMQWCLDCHRDPAPALGPPGAQFRTAAAPPPPAHEGGALLALYGIEPSRLDHCYVCHR